MNHPDPENRIRVTAADHSFQLEYNLSQDFSVWDQKRHSNAAYELHIVLSGSCTVSVQENTLHLASGDVLVILPGIHHMSTTGSGGVSHLSVSFAETGEARFPAESTEYLLVRADEEILQSAQSLVLETCRSLPCREELLTLLLQEVFLRVLRKLLPQASSLPVKKKKTGDIFDTSRIRNDLIDDFFEKHHSENVNASLLASTLGVSTRQLSRILRQNYGMGYSEKMNAARMDHAAWLLRTTDLSVSAISEIAGFSSEGNLFRHFRTRFGKTPKQYRLGM